MYEVNTQTGKYLFDSSSVYLSESGLGQIHGGKKEGKEDQRSTDSMMKDEMIIIRDIREWHQIVDSYLE